MARRRRDVASISFHYLRREMSGGGGTPIIQLFQQSEFDSLCDNIQMQPWPDLDDEGTLERLRHGSLIPMRNFQRVNDRLARGTFQNSYTGHAFHNTKKGKIDADSLNQREFWYLIYLSDDGRIFIGAQYLGNYGGYEALRWGLTRHLNSREGVKSYSFRKENYGEGIIRPKEVRINIQSSGRDDEDNVLTRKRVVILKRDSSDDLQFEEAARTSFISFAASDSPDKRRDLARLLQTNRLMSADDEEVENCVVLAEVDGRDKRIHVLGSNTFATRFFLNVPYNVDGHPEPIPTAEAIVEVLEREILSMEP